MNKINDDKKMSNTKMPYYVLESPGMDTSVKVAVADFEFDKIKVTNEKKGKKILFFLNNKIINKIQVNRKLMKGLHILCKPLNKLWSISKKGWVNFKRLLNRKVIAAGIIALTLTATNPRLVFPYSFSLNDILNTNLSKIAKTITRSADDIRQKRHRILYDRGNRIANFVYMNIRHKNPNYFNTYSSQFQWRAYSGIRTWKSNDGTQYITLRDVKYLNSSSSSGYGRDHLSIYTDRAGTINVPIGGTRKVDITVNDKFTCLGSSRVFFDPEQKTLWINTKTLSSDKAVDEVLTQPYLYMLSGEKPGNKTETEYEHEHETM